MLALVDRTSDSVTRAGVAGVPSRTSFDNTLVMMPLPGSVVALSLTASMMNGARTATVTVALSQFDGDAISQMR